MSMKSLSTRLLNYVSNKTRGRYDEEEIISTRLQCASNREAAAALGIPRRTVDRTVARVVERAEEQGEVVTVDSPNILVLDIESAPILGFMWHFWKGGTAPAMYQRPSYVMSWAAKWLGEDDVMADAICYNEDYQAGDEDDTRMLLGIWELLDDADFVVAHNGDNFDLKKLNTAFLLAGMGPPAPYKSIDTLKILKRKFKFDSNKLDYVLQQLEDKPKHDSGGFETWRGCMAGDMGAWEKLIEYNIEDVKDLERIYLRVRSWDHLHPSFATHKPIKGELVCTVCGSENVTLREGKTVSTAASVFQLYTCDDCGHHMRSRQSLLTTQQANNSLQNAK